MAIALALAGCAASSAPQTVFNTNDFPVGSTYTLGSLSVPEDAQYPLVVTKIEVLRTEGVRVLGARAHNPSSDGWIGLIPSWDPAGLGGEAREPGPDSAPFTAGPVALVVGIETQADRSGLRGLRATWRDAAGAEHSTQFDLAVVTCAPGVCAAGEDEQLVRELGLLTPGR